MLKKRHLSRLYSAPEKVREEFLQLLRDYPEFKDDVFRLLPSIMAVAKQGDVTAANVIREELAKALKKITAPTI